MDIQTLHVLSGDGHTADLRRVRCPVRLGTVTFEECLSCAESAGVQRDPAGRIEFASCRHAGAGGTRRRGAPAVRHPTPLAALMTGDVFAVRPDVSLDALASVLLERGLGAAPVVDEEGRPIGLVSKTDLVEHRFTGDTGEVPAPGWHTSRGRDRLEPGPGLHVEAAPSACVEDVMTPAAYALPEDAAVEDAAAMMVTRGIHRVLVVSGDGKLSGIVSASDVVRWVARRIRKAPAEA